MPQTKDWITLVSQFKNQTLPKTEWNHKMHLVVALWCLLEHKDIHRALCHLRSGIILYNHSVGIQNTESCGYHETITVFWVKKIQVFIESQNSTNFNALVEKLVNAYFADKDYILSFYKKETLKSSEARCLYITPDKEDV